MYGKMLPKEQLIFLIKIKNNLQYVFYTSDLTSASLKLILLSYLDQNYHLQAF